MGKKAKEEQSYKPGKQLHARVSDGRKKETCLNTARVEVGPCGRKTRVGESALVDGKGSSCWKRAEEHEGKLGTQPYWKKDQEWKDHSWRGKELLSIHFGSQEQNVVLERGRDVVL